MTQQEKYNKRSAASIASLRPDFGVRVQQWLDKCRASGLNPLIHMGARSVKVQEKLYDLYINHHGPKAAPPRRSYHCYGRAVDWVNIVATNGNENDLDWNSLATYQKGIRIATAFNLHSIGASDIDHLQDGNFASWRNLKRSELIPV
ncbi:MAG: D-alanyl-D-alanine carboxypeptidase [Acidobacteriota bacterium]|jgi:LAS superfamily LD-carboxypeptidase LdcB|nr:D-alanyl-D-alanine carboxypeptidase [Acidobacteriota bacterium]